MLRLTLRAAGSIPIEADALRPDRMAKLSTAEVARLSLHHGNRQMTVGDLFTIDGDPADGVLEIEGDCSRVKGIGRGMSGGEIRIRGAAGWHLGAGMTGGRIEVFGPAGDWLGAEMRGGHIHIHGDAGNCVGAVYRGGTKGMRGGVILIDGNAGHEVGSNMRRGLIAVRGRVGDMAGHAMIAGSVFAFGGLGSRCGAGMKRGTLVGFQHDFQPPPTFRPSCDYSPTFLHLYMKQLAAWGFAVPAVAGKMFRRYGGDLLALGKGEILIANPGFFLKSPAAPVDVEAGQSDLLPPSRREGLLH